MEKINESSKIKKLKLHKYEGEIILNIQKLISKGSYFGNHLIISEQNDDNVYVQMIFEKDNNNLYFEAVSNEFLPQSRKLSNDKITKLKELGFEYSAAESPNYYLNFDVSNEDNVKIFAQFIIRIFTEIYNSSPNVALDFDLHLS